MKLASSLSLCFLFFALIITKLPIAFSNDSAEQVLDSSGNPIFPGGTFHIIPLNPGRDGGSVRLGKTGDLKCPITVLQSYSEVARGIPIKLTIPGISTGEIFTGSEVQIQFLEKPNCSKSSQWLVFFDNDIQKYCVGIGGPENYPGKKTKSGVFKIQRSNGPSGYKLVFCYSVRPEICSDIGRFDNHKNEGGRRLILTKQEPFNLVFENAAA